MRVLIAAAFSGCGGPVEPGDVDGGICTPAGLTSGWTFGGLGVGKKPAIAVGPDGTVHAAFIDETTDGWIRYARVSAGATGAMAVDTVTEGYYYGPLEMLIASDGEPRVLYHDHTPGDQVMAERSSTGEWTLQRMSNDGHDGWYGTGVVGPDGTIHTASYDPSGFSGLGVIYGAWSGSEWEIELAAAGSFDYAGGTAIGQTADGRIHIAFFDDVAGDIRLTTRNGPGDWTVSTVEAAGGNFEAGRFPDLAVDPDGETLHLVYLVRSTSEQGVIRYARGTPGAFEMRDVTYVSGFAIGFAGARDMATLDLDGSAQPVVAVQTLTRLDLFRVTNETVVELAAFQAPPDVSFGQQTEVEVDDAGRIHVAWWQSGELPGTICHAVSG